MILSIGWVPIGELDRDEADGWQNRARLDAIVSEIDAKVGSAADFLFLSCGPGRGG